VVVGGNGYRSDPRVLSLWKGNVSFGYSNPLNGNSRGSSGSTTLSFNYRLDFSFLLKHHSISNAKITIEKNSFLEIANDITVLYDFRAAHAENWHVPQTTVPILLLDSSYSFGFQTKCSLAIDEGVLTIQVHDVKGVQEQHAVITNGQYNVVGYENFPISDFTLIYHFNDTFDTAKLFTYNVPSGQGITSAPPVTIYFPQPNNILQLWHKPNLISPFSGSFFSFKDNVILLWDSLSLMSGYHIQISTDSLFDTNFIDTIISSLTTPIYSLHGLIKYYWRVAGVNSEGESRWSDVWYFSTGATADVKNFSNSSTISISPNPAANEITIRYFTSEASKASIEIYDLLGNKITSADNNNPSAGEHQMKFDASRLPLGMYILKLRSGNAISTEKFSVLR